MIRFQLIGETPSKKNSKIRTRSGYMIPSKAHEKWHSDALIQLNSQLCRMGPEAPNMIESPVIVYIDFYHGNMVRRDSDNQVSSIMDLLQDAKIIADDRWEIIKQIHVRNFYEKNDARCLIEIEEYHD